jgi:hypothetical protein
VTLVLLAFGVGVGFSVVSPWSDQGVSSTTLHRRRRHLSGRVAMLASTVGGYLAGRLRNRWAGVHHDEVYFRDTAHGFLAWAFATVLTAGVLGGATTHILAGASAGLAPAARASANSAGNPTDTYVENCCASMPTPARGSGGPCHSATRLVRAPANSGVNNYYGSPTELGRIIASGMTKGVKCPPPIGPTPPRLWPGGPV